MEERRVKGILQGDEGEILEICGEWGRRSQSDAIREIESGAIDYYVEEAGVRTRVNVVGESDGSGEKRLETTDDPGADNHLTQLPEC